MCGRFDLLSSPREVRAAFGYVEQPNFPPRDAIAPTQPVAVVHAEAGQRHLTLMRWGFLPSWVKDPAEFPLIINIRSETAAEKPSFREALRRRRAIIPADGFFEWRREGKARIPHRISLASGGLMAFAALHDDWTDRDGGSIITTAIMTTAAAGRAAELHDRMPLILPPSVVEQWLDPKLQPRDIAALIAENPVPDLVVERVEPPRPRKRDGELDL